MSINGEAKKGIQNCINRKDKGDETAANKGTQGGRERIGGSHLKRLALKYKAQSLLKF
uniref:Uncharacterized protein n=1 Tax=Rhizophora mucronata TaxID=61149 RepID=A0A2P2Q8R4_RHIMU